MCIHNTQFDFEKVFPFSISENQQEFMASVVTNNEGAWTQIQLLGRGWGNFIMCKLEISS